MFGDSQDPQQRIIHDRIDMCCYRIAAAQSKQRTAFDISICQKIAVHKKALVGISAPDPFIPFDAVCKEDSRTQPESMCRDVPNSVQHRIIAGKMSVSGMIDIFINGSNIYGRSGNKCKTDCTAGRPAVFRSVMKITMRRIQRFIPGFSGIDCHLCQTLFGCVYLQFRCQFRFPFI